MVIRFLLLPLRETLVSFFSHLSFSEQVSSAHRARFYHIRDPRRIRPVSDFDMARTISTSFVHSRLDYCSSMYYCLPQTQLNRLQHTQNALTCAGFAAPMSSNPDHIFTSLNWLKVRERIE